MSTSADAPQRTSSARDAVDYAFVNPDLNNEARQLRQDIPMRAEPGALDEYIRCWSEDDVIDGRPCKALVVILKTRGCTWALAGGCTMCGYANESAWQKVSVDQLVAQFERAWRKYDGEELVKIYTSGSFVDRHEVMPEAQTRILEIIGTRAVWDEATVADESDAASAQAVTDDATSPAASASRGTTSAAAASGKATSSAASGKKTSPAPSASARTWVVASPTEGTAGSAGRGGAAAVRSQDGAQAEPGVGGGERGAGEDDARPGDAHHVVGTSRSEEREPGGSPTSQGKPAASLPGNRSDADRRLVDGSGPGVRKVAFESLPGFIQDDTFTELAGLVPKLEVGIGVESANDRVLTDSINKGHGFATFPRAAAICREHDVSVKAYLMCKPPFLTEADALQDAMETIIKAAPHSNVVSLNPTNIQGRTVVDALYKRGSYRAPWLWTLVHAVLEGDKVARAADAEGGAFTGILKSDVIAAGQDRGAHNCGQCDERVVKYLKKYKDTQDRTWLEQCLEKVRCPCRKEWQLTLELGRLVPAYAQF